MICDFLLYRIAQYDPEPCFYLNPGNIWKAAARMMSVVPGLRSIQWLFFATYWYVILGCDDQQLLLLQYLKLNVSFKWFTCLF